MPAIINLSLETDKLVIMPTPMSVFKSFLGDIAALETEDIKEITQYCILHQAKLDNHTPFVRYSIFNKDDHALSEELGMVLLLEPNDGDVEIQHQNYIKPGYCEITMRLEGKFLAKHIGTEARKAVFEKIVDLLIGTMPIFVISKNGSIVIKEMTIPFRGVQNAVNHHNAPSLSSGIRCGMSPYLLSPGIHMQYPAPIFDDPLITEYAITYINSVIEHTKAKFRNPDGTAKNITDMQGDPEINAACKEWMEKYHRDNPIPIQLQQQISEPNTSERMLLFSDINALSSTAIVAEEKNREEQQQDNQKKVTYQMP